MIFFGQPLARGQSTSRLFENYGAKNIGPAPISASRIYPLLSLNALRAVQLFQMYLIPAIISAAFGVKVEDIYKCIRNIAGRTLPEADFLFNFPPLVVSIPGKADDAKTDKLRALGFTRQSAGKYMFYKGPPTISSIPALLKLGSQRDAYAPQETISIDGLLTGLIFKRILHVFFSVSTVIPTLSFAATEILLQREAYKITSLEDVKMEAGHFFPYFDGLCLPDRATTPQTFIRLFSRLFGDSDSKIAQTVLLLASGWETLYNTTAGRIISHMVAVIDLAVALGGTCHPVYFNDEYCGIIVETTCQVLTGAKAHAPADLETLKVEISKMRGHEDALAEVARLLSTCKLDATSETAALTPEEISTPRALHYACRARTVPADTMALINTEKSRLKFNDTLWSPTDKKYVATVTQTIMEGKFLPVSAPFDMRVGTLFTKDKILSALSSFGVSAPSLVGTTPVNVSLPVKKGMYEDYKRGGTIRGIPVFVKPLQQAAEDWSKLVSDGVVSFKAKGKDNMGRLRIADCGMYIEKGDEYGRVMGALVQRAGQKRKRGAEDEPEAPKAKKAKGKAKEEFADILGDFGFTDPVDVLDEVDEDEGHTPPPQDEAEIEDVDM